MYMRDDNRKHTSYVTMFSLVTSLHLGDLLKFNDIVNECAEQ